MTQPRGGNTEPANPYVWQTSDDAGLVLTVSFSWTPGTRALSGILVDRQPGCWWDTILVGLGVDGRPNATERRFTVPDGVTQVPGNILNQLAAKGLATIDDVRATQITAINSSEV